jgi:hypothetical protein
VAAEEADESVLWIEQLTESGIVNRDMTEALLKEAKELAPPRSTPQIGRHD